MAKKRILNERLASIVASIRHGELICIADAGASTGKKSLRTLDPDVEYLDLEAVTGSPSFKDIVEAINEAGDFEGAIVTEDMVEKNPEYYQLLIDMFGEDSVCRIPYHPNWYDLRDKCKAVVQTGDYGVHAQAMLIAGYTSAKAPLELYIKMSEGNDPF